VEKTTKSKDQINNEKRRDENGKRKFDEPPNAKNVYCVHLMNEGKC
jgi:hypothetical protein